MVTLIIQIGIVILIWRNLNEFTSEVSMLYLTKNIINMNIFFKIKKKLIVLEIVKFQMKNLTFSYYSKNVIT